MKKSYRLCGFCGTFTDVETTDNPDKKTQVKICTKCGRKYDDVVMDKKTTAPKYLWEKLNDRRTG